MQSSNRRPNPNALGAIIIFGILLGLFVTGMLKTQNSTVLTEIPTPTPEYFITIPTQPIEDKSLLDLQILKVGVSAPDFVLPDRTGNPVVLSDLLGSIVVVNFWASWCEPCRDEMPILQAIYDKYVGKGLVVLGVNTTYIDSREEALAFIDGLNLTFPIVFDETGEVGEKMYKVYGLPTSYWIDREGIIRWTQLGAMTEDQMLEILSPLLEP